MRQEEKEVRKLIDDVGQVINVDSLKQANRSYSKQYLEELVQKMGLQAQSKY